MRIPKKILFILLPLALAAILGSGQDWNTYAEAWLRGEPYYFGGEPFYSNGEPYF
jgi:hypothetical protein